MRLVRITYTIMVVIFPRRRQATPTIKILMMKFMRYCFRDALYPGIKPFLVQRGSFQGVAKCYD
jgi:hypothetical protein